LAAIAPQALPKPFIAGVIPITMTKQVVGRGGELLAMPVVDAFGSIRPTALFEALWLSPSSQ
jgi:hypothetical protein